MLHGLGSSASSSAQSLAALFKKLDTNSDNSVSKAEFVTGRPDDVSEDQAGSLFDSLDSSGTGTLSQTDFTSAFQQMSSGMHNVLLQAQEGQQGDSDGDSDGSSSSDSNGETAKAGHHHHGHGGKADAAEMFQSLDTDGNGTVTRDEFVSGRPDNVSEDQAGAFFDKIASAAGADGTTGLTQDQLASGLEKAGPPDKASGTDSTQTSATDSSSSTSTEQQLLDQLLALLQSGSSASSGTSSGQGQDASKMFSDLDSDGDGTVTRAEFVAGRPDNVSGDQAGEFYDKISSAAGTDGSSGLTEDQLASGLQKAGPPGPPPPPDGTSTASSSSTSSTSDSDTTQTASTQGTTTDQLLQELLKAIGSYQKANYQSVANTSLAA